MTYGSKEAIGILEPHSSIGSGSHIRLYQAISALSNFRAYVMILFHTAIDQDLCDLLIP